VTTNLIDISENSPKSQSVKNDIGRPVPSKNAIESPFDVKNMAMLGLLGQISSSPHKTQKELQQKTQNALDVQKSKLELFQKDLIIGSNTRKLKLYKNVHLKLDQVDWILKQKKKNIENSERFDCGKLRENLKNVINLSLYSSMKGNGAFGSALDNIFGSQFGEGLGGLIGPGGEFGGGLDGMFGGQDTNKQNEVKKLQEAQAEKIKKMAKDRAKKKEIQRLKRKRAKEQKVQLAAALAARAAEEKRLRDIQLEEQSKKADEMRQKMNEDRLALKKKLHDEAEAKREASAEGDARHLAAMEAKEARRLYVKRKIKAAGWFFFFPKMFFGRFVKDIIARKPREIANTTKNWND
jgi:hypothetical protein